MSLSKNDDLEAICSPKRAFQDAPSVSYANCRADAVASLLVSGPRTGRPFLIGTGYLSQCPSGLHSITARSTVMDG
jgi:hypothetical protein